MNAVTAAPLGQRGEQAADADHQEIAGAGLGLFAADSSGLDRLRERSAIELGGLHLSRVLSAPVQKALTE